MADYVSCKVCKELILSILGRTNTVLAPWNTGLDDTYLTYPEDIGWVGMMLTRGCGILEGMEGDVILDIYKLKLCLAQQQDDPDR